MPVAIWSTKSVSVALPKTYHQLAVLRGTAWVATGVIAPASPVRASSQPATERSAAVIFGITLVPPGSEAVRRAPRAARSGLRTRTRRVRGAAARTRASRVWPSGKRATSPSLIHAWPARPRTGPKRYPMIGIPASTAARALSEAPSVKRKPRRDGGAGGRQSWFAHIGQDPPGRPGTGV